jgi:hypothetical protein
MVKGEKVAINTAVRIVVAATLLPGTSFNEHVHHINHIGRLIIMLQTWFGSVDKKYMAIYP